MIITKEELKDIRNSLNFTQAVFADKLGVSLSAYQSWEKTKGNPITQSMSNLIVLTTEKITGEKYQNKKNT